MTYHGKKLQISLNKSKSLVNDVLKSYLTHLMHLIHLDILIISVQKVRHIKDSLANRSKLPCLPTHCSNWHATIRNLYLYHLHASFSLLAFSRSSPHLCSPYQPASSRPSRPSSNLYTPFFFVGLPVVFSKSHARLGKFGPLPDFTNCGKLCIRLMPPWPPPPSTGRLRCPCIRCPEDPEAEAGLDGPTGPGA